MLSERTIDEVVDGVRMCHRELIVHGTDVILNRLVTANKPLTPASAPESSSQSRAASSSSSSSSSPAAAAAAAAHQADVVALEWSASRPCPQYGEGFQPLLGETDWKNRSNFTYLHVNPKKRFNKTNPGEGTMAPPPAADLIVWHRFDRVLELQADAGFTRTSVLNAFARELALNSAKILLLLEEIASDDEDYDDAPEGDDSPMDIGFVARFKANVRALVEEARWAPAASSISHSSMPENVKDKLREESARNRREHVDQEKHWKLVKEYEAAVRTHKNLEPAGGASASSAPAAGNIPEKPKPLICGAEPVSPDPLAASPPPVVLRPFEDLFRVFTEVEIMKMFRKEVLSRTDCVLCPGFEVWFEKKRAVKMDDGVMRHEFVEETGTPYC